MGLQTLCLIGQFADHSVPDGEALVARFTGRELPVVTPGALVAARAEGAFHTGTLSCRAMTLLAGDSPRVAVTSWEYTERKVREENRKVKESK